MIVMIVIEADEELHNILENLSKTKNTFIDIYYLCINYVVWVDKFKHGVVWWSFTCDVGDNTNVSLLLLP